MARNILTVDMAELNIRKWEKVKSTIQRSENIDREDDIETLIFKLYLKHQSLDEVVTEINSYGKRIASARGSRKYVSSDVSNIIKTSNIQDEELQELVKKLFDDAKKFIDKIFG